MIISIHKDDSRHAFTVTHAKLKGSILFVYDTPFGNIAIDFHTVDCADDSYTCLVAKGYLFVDEEYPATEVAPAELDLRFLDMTDDCFKEYVDLYNKLTIPAVKWLYADSPDIVDAIVFNNIAKAKRIGKPEFDMCKLSFDKDSFEDGCCTTIEDVTKLLQCWNKATSRFTDRVKQTLPDIAMHIMDGSYDALQLVPRNIIVGLCLIGGTK